ARPASQLVKPPIQVYGLEGRYATALYSAASKQKKLDQVEKELSRVSTLLKDPKLSSVVVNPHVKSVIKQKTINDALVKEKLSPITINFMKLLAENGRLQQTPDVISAFGKIMSAYRGEVLCSVTTANVIFLNIVTKPNHHGFVAKRRNFETKSKFFWYSNCVRNKRAKYCDTSK
uniref:ATP synthase peripheral stalk subunit OSCP, mitochondrial n=1 Tax=Gopherus agassizii TaxID=38772 RepID=A0A452GZ82_9SAUR